MNTIKQRFENLKKKKKKGFTLIELVVVIAIMAILALIMVPNLTAYIAKSEVATVKANMKNVHTAAEMAIQLDPTNAIVPTEIAKYSNIDNIITSEAELDTQGEYLVYVDGEGRAVVEAMTKDGTTHKFNGVEYTETPAP